MAPSPPLKVKRAEEDKEEEEDKMIEIRILKIDERINDSSNISKLPTDFNGQVIRKHDPNHDIYVIAGNVHDVPKNQIEGLPMPDPLGRNTRW